MLKKGYFLLLPFTVLLLSACKEYPTPEPMVKEGSPYFPLEIGTQHTYRVKETKYDGFGIPTNSYYWLREEITEKFTDLQGYSAFKAFRSKLSDTTNLNGWVTDSVIVYTVAGSQLQRVQSNLRFIDLVFPATQGKTWNPNELNEENSLDWTYSYQDIGATVNIGQRSFQNTLVVHQNNSTLLDSITTTALYSKGAGLVSLDKVKLRFDNGPAGLTGNINGGFTIHQTLIP
jgi:hypothetical protein